ncbi:MAG: DUF559 domain-containing protein, partial [Patescibacteria group bacterium]|nr:DUF559 domain-containing protein [Patescibacteria group bacterium]
EADQAIYDAKIAVMCDGCHWHDCPTHAKHKPWQIARSILDGKQTKALEAAGWTVLRLWEHDINADHDIVGRAVEAILRERGILELVKPDRTLSGIFKQEVDK